MRARLLRSAADLPTAAWDALAGPCNPFACHGFLSSLEESGSAAPETGWAPMHLLLEDGEGQALGLMPGYAKGHSRGEYVFDQGWAEAWMRAGGAYYPKLQLAVPFTAATSPRLLSASSTARAALVSASETLVRQQDWSSAHATFLTDQDCAAFAAAGWLERHDIQFHFDARGITGFDDFLARLPSRKRKGLKRERAEALAGIDEVVWLTGRDLTEAVWDEFFACYVATGNRKWGQPYLKRAFFSLLSQRMADRVLLVAARQGGRLVAGALNFIGADCLYGRNWGAIVDIPFLHFELCYHQAIDIAGQLGLARVEAGAQGPHKVRRGYRPVRTRSYHWLADLRLRAAVADFLERERAGVAREVRLLEAELPFSEAAAPAPTDGR